MRSLNTTLSRWTILLIVQLLCLKSQGEGYIQSVKWSVYYTSPESVLDPASKISDGVREIGIVLIERQDNQPKVAWSGNINLYELWNKSKKDTPKSPFFGDGDMMVYSQQSGDKLGHYLIKIESTRLQFQICPVQEIRDGVFLAMKLLETSNDKGGLNELIRALEKLKNK
jgi:hypothetical protein